MEAKKLSISKLLITILFAGIIFAAYFFVIFGEIKYPLKTAYFSYACVCACCLFALLFLRSKKQLLVVLALAVTVVADYFLILFPSEQNRLIGACVFCAVQLVYAIYTLVLNKSIGVRVVNIALRVALCLIAYFVVPIYFELALLEMIALMYIINFVVSILFMLIHIKTEWLMLLGYLLFFACDIFVGLSNGGAEILGITGNFLALINGYDFAFYFYIPGLFLIALSSVWRKKENE